LLDLAAVEVRNRYRAVGHVTVAALTDRFLDGLADRATG
jgi:hypothetical protein